MESKIANELRYSGMDCRNQLIGGIQAAEMARPWQPTPEQIAEKEAQEKEYRRRSAACMVVECAEKLVLTHNLSVSDAFDKALTLCNEAKAFVDNYKLAE